MNEQRYSAGAYRMALDRGDKLAQQLQQAEQQRDGFKQRFTDAQHDCEGLNRENVQLRREREAERHTVADYSQIIGQKTTEVQELKRLETHLESEITRISQLWRTAEDRVRELGGWNPKAETVEVDDQGGRVWS